MATIDYRAGGRILFGFALLAAAPLAVAQGDEPVDGPDQDVLAIDGIVVNHLGGGISGAEVRIELPDAAAADPPLAQTWTGLRGEIVIEIPRPNVDELRYRVLADGFAEQVGTLDISDPDESPFIDATLRGAARITGRITAAADGRAIADARVLCHSGGRRFTGTTDADGRYDFDSVYFGPAAVTVTAKGFGTQRDELVIEDDQNTLDFALEPERPIELTVVTNTGQPAADVWIEARTEPRQTYLSAKSDAAGQVRLSGVDLDSTGLHIRLNGERYLSMRSYEHYLELPSLDGQSRPATTQPAIVRGRFTVMLAGRVRGRITDKETGQPIRNVRVLAGREPRYDMPMDWSGPSGTYELIGVRPGVVTVTFQHDGYATLFHDVDVATGQTSTVDAGMERGVAIGGVVVDAEGLPVDQVRVMADNWKEYQTLGLRAITDSKGRFDLAHVPPGDIEFTFVQPGYGRRATVELAAGKTDHVVQFESTEVPVTSGAMPIEEPKLAIGQEVADLRLVDTDGVTYQLSELRGKYVFLDCWASWCRPCIAEIPNVKALHKASRDRADFVLIGISLDTDAKALKRACDEHGISWPQIFGPRSGASEAFEELDGAGIPYTCLIGPDGKLLAQHLRGPEMVAEVRKLAPGLSGSSGDIK